MPQRCLAGEARETMQAMLCIALTGWVYSSGPRQHELKPRTHCLHTSYAPGKAAPSTGAQGPPPGGQQGPPARLVPPAPMTHWRPSAPAGGPASVQRAQSSRAALGRACPARRLGGGGVPVCMVCASMHVPVLKRANMRAMSDSNDVLVLEWDALPPHPRSSLPLEARQHGRTRCEAGTAQPAQGADSLVGRSAQQAQRSLPQRGEHTCTQTLRPPLPGAGAGGVPSSTSLQTRERLQAGAAHSCAQSSLAHSSGNTTGMSGANQS